MPAPQQAYYNFVAGPVAIVAATETVIATTRGVSSSYPGCVFAIEGGFDVLTAALTTGYAIRIHRDSLTGTQIYSGPTVAAAASTQLPRVTFAITDAPAGEVTSAIYVVTISAVGPAANGSAANIFTRVTVAE